ncbi:hypothetical protein Acr_28g0005830 [Actinidia rufa]|uniref:Uncharacterized protein n=1 Tax=Actinidia rufa TaxID=165716 RepID=A0A7J0HA37_9ERIC|nr:hypothetical protein Acr_28g0005830 [Actinidia rufa]
MDLDQAQLLVHSDDALDEFRTDHGIPDNIQIERPGPNEKVNTVEGMGNRSRYVGEVRFPPLRIQGRALPRRALSLIKLSAKLNEGVAIAREYDSAEEVPLSSSSSSLTNDDKKEVPQLVRRRRWVVDPILVLSLNSKDSNNLSSDQLHPISKDEIEHLYTGDSAANLSLGEKLRWVQSSRQLFVLCPTPNKRKSKQAAKGHSKRQKQKGEMSSASPLSLVEQAKLWNPEFFVVDLGKDPRFVGDAANLEHAESNHCVRAREVVCAELKKSKKKVINVESKIKLAKFALTTIDHLKLDLVIAVEAQDVAMQLPPRPKMKLLLLWLKRT